MPKVNIGVILIPIFFDESLTFEMIFMDELSVKYLCNAYVTLLFLIGIKVCEVNSSELIYHCIHTSIGSLNP